MTESLDDDAMEILPDRPEEDQMKRSVAQGLLVFSILGKANNPPLYLCKTGYLLTTRSTSCVSRMAFAPS